MTQASTSPACSPSSLWTSSWSSLRSSAHSAPAKIGPPGPGGAYRGEPLGPPGEHSYGMFADIPSPEFASRGATASSGKPDTAVVVG
ncbi:hypothetical protein M422DRAFT_260765 [Sphaerobolus stellatus SS14]|uniref:Uncharacterized protein n=1 Tax=Sphaerobolus stellatus (strain SS14) TaxID=990650 RepID=A0A0C9UQF1_SPHS4|nr:hypothetical protein M422DRAFT_260765 [Sphaerobolus stellatus SS14]